MSLAHVHLLSNHIPVIGLPLVAVVLIAALWMRSSDVAKLALLMLAGIAILSVIPYVTGESAEDAVRNIAGVTRASIHEHDDAAGFAFTGTCIIGAGALLLLWLHRRRELSRKWIGWSLALVLVVSTIMARTAYLGGLIRHSEIHGATADSTAAK